MAKPPQVKLMLDSGAFSALHQNQPIDINEYIRYVKDNADDITRVVNLDVIPGSRADHKKVEEAAEGSWNNYKKMKKAGIDALPVFHIGENFKWLERMIKETDYIGLGGVAKVKQSVRRDWLDKVFSMLTTKDGRPLIKVHGFGLTQIEQIMRYPWHSVDSTSWAIGGGFGSIMVPQMVGDKPDFTKKYSMIDVAGRDRATESSDRIMAVQYEAMSPAYQAVVNQWLAMNGTDIIEVRNVPDMRRRMCAVFYQGLSRQLYDVRFKWNMRDLVSKGSIDTSGFKPLPPQRLTLVFATSIVVPQWAILLTEIGAWDRLLSFFELKKAPSEALHQFVRRLGKYETRHRTKPARRWGNNNVGHYYKNRRRMELVKRAGREDAES